MHHLDGPGNETDKNIASAFGTLLYLYDTSNNLYLKACYILQSRAGNIVSAKHLEASLRQGNIIKHFSSSLDFELTSQKFLLEKRVSDNNYIYFTHFEEVDKLEERGKTLYLHQHRPVNHL
ncbi:hypothetical protein [Enterobacter cloacae complex sp. 358K9]|uniref:hypothetical protein n=1 Tax=Enterobacter cloacae complex sp. 358K9 TaxID=3395826 RepID=UPI003CE6BFB7